MTVSWKRVLLGVFLPFLLPVVSPPLHATAQCDISGGTTYRGCLLPENLWAVNGYTPAFPSRQAAFYWATAYDLSPTEKSWCNYGARNVPTVTPTPCQGDCSTPGYDPASENHHESLPGLAWGLRQFPMGSPFYPYQYQACQTAYINFVGNCPAGFSKNLEYPFTGSYYRLYTCYPSSSSSARGAERVAGIPDTPGCRDKALCAGSAFGANPVNLATRTKYDVQEDYRNYSPYPIVWARSYSSTAKRWTFSYDRSIKATHQPGLSKAYATLFRDDGSILRFKSDNAGTGSTPWTWVLDQGGGRQVVRSRLSDRRDGSGNRIGFRLDTLSEEVELYDLGGKLVAVEGRGGHGLTFNYDARGRLSRIDDDFGRYLEVSYNGGGIGQVDETYSNDDPDGGPDPIVSVFGVYGSGAQSILDRQPTSVTDGVDTVVYTYEGYQENSSSSWVARLSSVLQRDGTLIDYLYGETTPGTENPKSGLLTGIIGQDGQRFATYAYSNSAGQVASSTHGAGLRQITYGTSGSITDAYGHATTFNTSAFNTVGKTSGSSTPCPPEVCSGTRAKSITYDTYGNPLTLTDYNNRITTYTWDTVRALPLTIKQATGTPLERTKTYTWHANYRVPLTVVEPIKIGGLSGTRTTTYTYDNDGNPLTRSTSNPLDSVTRTEGFTYNSAGLLDTATDARGKTTAFDYDTDGNLIEVENALGQSTVLSGYTARGLPGKIVDENGLEVLLSYDTLDRITQVQRGSPATHWETTAISYLPIGRVDRITGHDGLSMKFLYDSAHDLVEVQQRSSSDVLLGKQVFTLDLMGRLTKQEVFDASGTRISSSSLDYNTLSQIAKQTGATSQETLFTYDGEGNLTGVEDPLAHGRTNTLDALNRISTVTDALNKTSTLAYDPQDNLVSATDARGVETTYTYNAFNELLSAASPDRGAWFYTYDAAGNPVSVSDPRGVVATATYDDLNRPLTLVYDASLVPSGTPGFVPGTRTVSWTWDTCTHGVGKLCSRTDWSGTTGYSYDLWGRLAGESFIPAGQTAPLANGYSYDTYGRLDARVYPSGKALVFTYGADGRVSSMAWAGSNVIEDMAWQPFEGPILGWKWSAAGIPATKSQVAFTYDLDGRMSHISDIDEIDLVHDDADRLVGTAHQAEPALDQVHDYDAADRLVSTDRSTWVAPWLYAWDEVGNRESRLQSGSGWQNAYGLTSNRLSSVAVVTSGVAGTPVSRTYDAMGNTIDDGAGKTYGFDAAGRMVSFNGGSTGATFVVGSEGLRTRKTVSGVGATDRLYAYDDQRRLVGVYIPDGSGGFTVSEELVYLPDSFRIVGTVRGQVPSGANGTFYPVLSDQIGSPRVVLDPSSGDARWTWQGKEAFGDSAPDENPVSVGTFRFDARFPGQWVDPETGLFHNGFRDYDPRTGRYVESDPIGLGGGWNTYAYVGGDPASMTDTLGLIIVEPKGSGRLVYKRQVEQLYRGSDHFRRVYNFLASTNAPVITITLTNANNQFIEDKVHGTGELRWNPNKSIVCGIPFRKHNPGIGLAHELGHAFGFASREFLREPDIYLDTKSEEEAWSLPFERAVAADMGWPAGRTYLEYIWSFD